MQISNNFTVSYPKAFNRPQSNPVKTPASAPAPSFGKIVNIFYCNESIEPSQSRQFMTGRDMFIKEYSAQEAQVLDKLTDMLTLDPTDELTREEYDKLPASQKANKKDLPHCNLVYSSPKERYGQSLTTNKPFLRFFLTPAKIGDKEKILISAGDQDALDDYNEGLDYDQILNNLDVTDAIIHYDIATDKNNYGNHYLYANVLKRLVKLISKKVLYRELNRERNPSEPPIPYNAWTENNRSILRGSDHPKVVEDKIGLRTDWEIINLFDKTPTVCAITPKGREKVRNQRRISDATYEGTINLIKQVVIKELNIRHGQGRGAKYDLATLFNEPKGEK